MRHARIRYQGRTWRAQAGADGALLLPDGRRLDETQAEWLPPCQGTLFALGLNYADHAAELDFKPPSEPLVFLKTAAALTGHRRQSMRPDNVEYMHYECELVAVIGKTTRKVKRAQAMDYVAGYTVCNDYAVRDYLENYYRPNLRVKNRDGLTPIGPWLVDRDEVADPHSLELATYVNGRRVQSGNTRDMVFDIPHLIEYLSAFMTLQAGDMIATGTPQGLSDVRPGDEVVVEVEGVGRLLNQIISEADWLARRNAEKETP